MTAVVENFDGENFAHVEKVREHVEKQLAFWAVEAMKAGLVPSVTLRPLQPLAMGYYAVEVDVRYGRAMTGRFFNEIDKKGTSQ